MGSLILQLRTEMLNNITAVSYKKQQKQNQQLEYLVKIFLLQLSKTLVQEFFFE